MRTSSDADDTRRRARAYLMATSPCTPSDLAADTAGAITVHHDGVTMVPSFQLDEHSRVYSVVAEVNAQLRAAGMDAWAVWSWWCGRRATIDATPADLIEVDHDALRAAVRRLTDPQG